MPEARKRGVRAGPFAILALVAANLPSAITLATGFVTSSWLAMISGAAAGVALGAVWLILARPTFPKPDALSHAIHHVPPGAFLLVLALLFPAYVAFTLVPSLRELRGEWPVVDIDAARATDAEIVEVRGGVVQHELVGRHSYKVKASKTHVLVAPLVGPRWARAEPVTVWLACVESYDAEETCKTAFSVERHLGRPETNDVDRFHQAMRDAEKAHGVRAAESPLILRMSADSRFDSWGDVVGFALFLVIANFVLLGMTGRRIQRQSPAQG